MIEARPEVKPQKYSRELGSYHEKKARDGHQWHLLQFQRRHEHRMLQNGEYIISRQAGLLLNVIRWSGVHASDFNPGFVTFVGTRNRGAWQIGSTQREWCGI